MKFKDIKVGDKVLVKRSQYGDPTYHGGVVTKVTGTRFTVKATCFGQASQQFTKNGDIYPREDGFGRTYVHLELWGAESPKHVKKGQLTQKIKNLAYEISKLLESSAVRNRMGDMELTEAQLDATLVKLTVLMDDLKQYKRD